MSDLIRVVDLEVWTRIGVPKAERAQPQRLLVTLEMRVSSLKPAAARDDVALTVNYFDVAESVKAFAATKSCRLLETFAEDLSKNLFAAYSIEKLCLQIKKFILPDAAYVSVEIERPD